MMLNDLLDALDEKTITGRQDVRVRRVTHDSRLVEPGDVFVAIREPSGHDGHAYIPAAVERGAVAVVQERPPCVPAVTTVVVPDSNRALALLADRVYGHPARALTLVGITGTNGKTTVTHLVESILRAHGQSTGLIGTLGYRLNGDTLPMDYTHTTPYPTQLQALLRMIADRGGRYAVMEVSSHALALDRVYGLQFQVAALTNLTRDHLDFHPTFEAYRMAKLRLFQEFLSPDGTAVINRDDPSSGSLIAEAAGTALTYGLDRTADVSVDGTVEVTPRGTVLPVRTPDGTWRVHLRLLGRFNVSNALAALGVGLALRLPPAAIVAGLEAVETIPGRLERVDCGQPFTVVVDYAHTPDALRATLAVAREWTAGRLIAVFGCGGDRDRGKRPEMGAIASRTADLVIITSDNPRSEDPGVIIREIEAGVEPSARCRSIVDRREAIAEALSLAQDGDTVVIAGKGHEPYQDIGSERIHFDDRNVVRDLLS